MAASLDDIQGNVQNLELALNKIHNTLGGFNFTDKKTIERNINDVIKKIKANTNSVNEIKNTTNRISGGENLKNIHQVISEINGYVKNISNGIKNSSKNPVDLSRDVKDAVDLLKKIEQHIGNIPSNTAPSNNSSNASSINNIDKNVEGILEEIKNLRIDLASKLFNTGDTALDDKLREVAGLKADNDLRRLKRDENLEKAKSELYSALESGDKKRIKKAKEDYRKEFDKRRKEDETVKKLETRKGEGAAKVVKTVSGAVTGFISEKPDASKSIDKGISAISNLGPAGSIVGSVLSVVKSLYDLGSKQDKLTTELARNIGGSQTGKRIFGESVGNLIKTAPSSRGYTAELAYGAMNEIAEARGRSTERLSAEALGSAIDLKRFGIGAEAINNFDTFGKSIEETDKYFAKLYNEVSKKGLSFKNVSKAVNDNLKAAQSHTFANGLRGLEQMAERSVQLKYNMQQVFQFADKVSEIEGAISTAANLSVLGGSFAQYSNPMQLLYEGLNDSEALQKRMEGMFGDKAFWNSKTKQMDMTALDKEFVKQAAKAAGLNPDEMLSLSYNQGKMKRIESQIGPGLGKDTTEYIKNIAELDENGNAMVTLDGVTKAVSELNETDKELLKKESDRKAEADNAKLGNIYDKTRSINERMDNLLTYVQEKIGRWVYGIFQKVIGREEANRENVREWAAKNGKDEKSALEFFEQNHDKKRFLNWGKGGSFAAGYNDKYFSTHMDDMLKEFGGNIQKSTPKAANGINPFIPGGNGILSGPSHLDGGILGINNGKPWEAEGSEYLINKNSSIKYKYELAKIQNGTFNPYSYSNELIKNDMNRYFNAMKVAPAANIPAIENKPNKPNSVNGTIKIDIPQTITIKLENGTNIGELDTTAITSMVAARVMQEWKKIENLSGYNKEDFPYKNVIA